MSEHPQSNNDWENTLLWFKITEKNTENWIGNRWGTAGVRVENIPRTHHTADDPRNPSINEGVEL